MLSGVLNEYRREGKQSRQAQTDTHAVDNSHMSESISGAECRFGCCGQFATWVLSFVITNCAHQFLASLPEPISG
jgi:hypothetical protein